MAKVKVVYQFQDIHTGAVYNVGDTVDFAQDRLEEVMANLPGFVVPFDEEEVKPKKKAKAKTKEVADALPEADNEV